jgi:hypothetical protein
MPAMSSTVPVRMPIVDGVPASTASTMNAIATHAKPATRNNHQYLMASRPVS